jgi:hypothetical protein
MNMKVSLKNSYERARVFLYMMIVVCLIILAELVWGLF